MPTAPIRFADIEIDPRRRELQRAGVAVAVESRVFDLLLYLIEHRDRAVGKHELQDAVWAGRIVTEAALTRAVMKARRAVGDDPKRQELIRTVHGHGYQFVGTLDAGDESARAVKAPPRAVLWTSTVVALLALIAVAALYLIRPPGSPSEGVAVLPVADRTERAELAWVRLGLMEYINRLLAEATGRPGVPSRRLLDLDKTGADDLQQLRERLGATHLIAAELAESDRGLTLHYRVARPTGLSTGKVSGVDPTTMARRMVQQFVATLPGAGLRRQFRSVSEDPFVNETYARGLSLQLQGEIARAREFFRVAVSQAPELFWPRYELALCMRDMGELDAAGAQLEQLLDHPGAQRDPYARASAQMALGQVHRLAGRLDASADAFQSALSAVGSEHPRIGLVARINLGIVLRQLDRPEEARDHLLIALTRTRERGEQVPGAIYQSLGQIERELGNLELALDYYHRARDAFEADGNRRFAAASTSAMARVHHRLGQFVEAEANLTTALAEREALGDRFGVIHTHQALAALYRDAERWPEAARHADTALAQAEQTDSTSEIVSLLADRIQIALMAGDPGTARAALARWHSDFPDRGNPERRRVLTDWAALTVSGDPEAQRRLTGQLDQASPPARLDIANALARHAPDRNTRLEWLPRAIEQAETLRQHGRALTLRAQLARELRADGRAEDALAVLEPVRGAAGRWPALAAGIDEITQAR